MSDDAIGAQRVDPRIIASELAQDALAVLIPGLLCGQCGGATLETVQACVDAQATEKQARKAAAKAKNQ